MEHVWSAEFQQGYQGYSMGEITFSMNSARTIRYTYTKHEPRHMPHHKLKLTLNGLWT